MALRTATVRLQRSEKEPTVGEVLTDLCDPDAIVAITSHNEEVDGRVQPVLVVVWRA